MSERIVRGASVSRWGVWGAIGLMLSLGGCGLDELEVPELDGPSELALSVRLTASPDILVADGFSTSLIQATLRGPNGEPLAGRSVFMGITDDAGRTADIGQLRSTGSGGIGTGLVLVTASNGVAQAAYESPVRTDFTANGSVMVQARPLGDDFEGAVYKSVRIELRSAEPRLFPQGPNGSPTCNFVVEAPSGQCTGVNVCTVRMNTSVLFQTRAFDLDGFIVRYQWYFGDGSATQYAPDQAHIFRNTGTFTVTHLVTDNQGGQSACQASLTVIP